MVGTYEYIQQHHADCRARAECSLGHKAQAQLHAQQQLARELLRRCMQRRRTPGLGKVQYSNTQPIVEAVCGYVLLVVYTCPTAVNQDHILRLDLYKMCFAGVAAFSYCRSPIPRPPPGTCDPFTLARSCLRRCPMLWACLCAVL